MGDTQQPEEQQPADAEQTEHGADQALAQQPPSQAGDDSGVKPDSLYDH
jgi:hypothetical protein